MTTTPTPIRRARNLVALSSNDERNNSYNATITSVVFASEGLRVFQVRPDEPKDPFEAGQYVPLGLGAWEPRFDGIVEDVPEARRSRLITRPYSISSPILDGETIHDPAHEGILEFYIALAQTEGPEPQAGLLTSRLWKTVPGQRVFIGPRIAGRYTLEPVGPDDDVLFLGTGTGEAPHNSMAATLARNGHRGRVTMLSTSRWQCDFPYTTIHRRLERRWSAYRYLPLSTREPADGVKRYVQDVLTDPAATDIIGFDLDPQRVHVFLCGNPSMVGKAEWADDSDEPTFATSGGALEILGKHGFTLDRKGKPAGNVHFEEYW